MRRPLIAWLIAVVGLIRRFTEIEAVGAKKEFTTENSGGRKPMADASYVRIEVS